MPTYRVMIAGETYFVEVPDPTERPVRAIIDGELFEVEVAGEPSEPAQPSAKPVAAASSPSQESQPEPQAIGAGMAAKAGDGEVTAPLPGTIVAVSVSEGDRVERGQELCVLEAMKMNNPIRATRGGVVEEIYVTVGQQVQHGTPLMVIAEG